MPSAELSSEAQPSALARRADLRLGIVVEVVTIFWMLASLGLLYFVIREGREALEEASGHAWRFMKFSFLFRPPRLAAKGRAWRLRQ